MNRPWLAHSEGAWSESRLVRLLSLGRSRPLGFAVLVALLVVSTMFPETRPLRGLRVSLFDTYQQAFPRERKTAPAVIVAIDEKSLERYGQWPWSRALLVRLLEKIGRRHPAAIGIDVLLPEPDRLSAQQLANSLPGVSQQLRRKLSTFPGSDPLLAQTIRQLPVVLGIAGLEEARPGSPPPRAAPFLVHGNDPTPYIAYFPGALSSLELISKAARGHGMIGADNRDGVVRRLPMVANIQGVLVPAFPIELLRVAARADRFRMRVAAHGVETIGFGDRQVPLNGDGSAWLYFGPSDPNRFVSAAQVLSGRLNASLFERKVVLIGFTGVGLQDYQVTPLRSRMAGIEIHAQVVENLFDQNILRRPNSFSYAERGMLVVCGVLLIWLVPRWRPTASAALYAGMLAALFAVGFLMFRTQHLLIDSTLPAAGATLVFGVLLAGTLADGDVQRRQLRRALASQQAVSTRMAGELEAARQIQLGILPPASSEFLRDARFTLHAVMDPAREVGGDLYDFFKLDADRLFFLVGDVSGKGLPASIFMAVSKALYKSIALRLLARNGTELGDVMRAANVEISRDNPGMLFVTLFAGVLNVASGRLEYCNAGHDPPTILRPGHANSGRLEGGGGPPLCAMDEFPYFSATHELMSGETLVLVTDGVPEAMDADRHLYGRQRLLSFLESMSASAHVSDIASGVQANVQNFVGTGERSDDLAIMALRWHGVDVRVEA